MPRYRSIRKRRGNQWTSETSARANKARWDADRARRDAEAPEIARHLEEIEVENLPRRQGDALGCLQWQDFRTGKVRRWVVRIGARIDQVTLEVPGGKPTLSHGWTWVMDHLRGYLAGRKS